VGGWGSREEASVHNRGPNRLKQLQDGLLHWETAVADFLETFGTWLHLENLDNACWIWRQWLEMILMVCVSAVWEARKTRGRGNIHLATDLGDCAGKNASTNLSELLNTTFMGVIREVRNGNNDQTSNMQLQA
jgi:hypothetical protein